MCRSVKRRFQDRKRAEKEYNAYLGGAGKEGKKVAHCQRTAEGRTTLRIAFRTLFSGKKCTKKKMRLLWLRTHSNKSQKKVAAQLVHCSAPEVRVMLKNPGPLARWPGKERKKWRPRTSESDTGTCEPLHNTYVPLTLKHLRVRGGAAVAGYRCQPSCTA